MSISDKNAPEGAIWVCLACGKTSPNKYRGGGGWDESCMLNSSLCRDDETLVRKTNGRVEACKAFGEGE